jgi:outer membrane protein assembly factor BamD
MGPSEAVTNIDARDTRRAMTGMLARTSLLTALLLGAGVDGPMAGVAPARAADTGQMDAKTSYELGMRYLKRGYYTKALEQLNRVRTYFRDDPYALKAELAIAEVHFQKNEWDAARLAYEDFMRAHPRYAELDEVVYKLGLTHARKAPLLAARDQAETVRALATWANFERRFPQSTHRDEVARQVGKARARLARKELQIARFYARRTAWTAVAGRLEALVRDYPDSPDLPEARARLGEAWLRAGRADLARAMLDTLRTASPDSRWTGHLAELLTLAPGAEGGTPSATPPPASP